jgi:hypothetical protein
VQIISQCATCGEYECEHQPKKAPRRERATGPSKRVEKRSKVETANMDNVIQFPVVDHYEQQKGRCKICMVPYPREKLTRDLDPQTGATRGYLCNPCMLLASKKIPVLARVIRYIETMGVTTDG